jgi:SAM-dependent methyltransferase
MDPRAATGFARDAGAYERGRPSYPHDAVRRAVDELGLGLASTVLDLAAGTGKLTRALVPQVGRVIAVDPSGSMLAELRLRVPGAEVHVGAAEAIPLADRSVDAVFVAEAFHWFRTEAACHEIARVLVPGGGLALLWNRAHWDDHGWSEPFNALVTPLREAAGRFPAGADEWRPRLERTGLFGPLDRSEFDHVHETGIDELTDLVASWSWIANLPDDERTALLARVRELLPGRGPIALRYRTELHWTRTRVRVGSPPHGTRARPPRRPG